MKRPRVHPDPMPEAAMRALQEQVTRVEAFQADYRQLEVDLEKKTRQQALLLETAQSLTASLDPTEVLRRITAGARQVVEAAGCDLYLLEENGHTLKPVISIDPDFPEEILATPLEVDSSLTGRCIIERRCILFNDPASQPGHFQIPGTPVEEDERIIAAPLMAEERAWGALCINRVGEAFTDEDLSLAEAYAALASTVLKNVRIHEKLAAEVKERKKTELALSESEERFRSLVQQSMQGIILLNEEGRYVEWNEAMHTITGIPAEEVMGKYYWDVQFQTMLPEQRTPEMLERVKHLTLDALHTGKASFFNRSTEVSFQRADGAIRTVQQVAFPIPTTRGFRIGGTYSDITDQKIAQEALQYRTEQIIHHQQILLRLNKADLSSLTEILHKVTEELAQTMQVERTSVWTYSDVEKKLVCKDLYLHQEDRHTAADPIPAEKFPRYFTALEKLRVIAAHDVCKDPNTSQLKKTYLQPLGITSMLDVPVRTAGKLSGVVCIEQTGPQRQWSLEEQDFAASMADIVALALIAAERHNTEEALRESEQKYRELTDNLPLIVFETDLNGRLTFANRYAFEKTVYTREDFEKGLDAMMMIAPEDRDRASRNMQRILQGKASSGHEYQAITKEGERYPVIIHSTRIMRDKKVMGLRGFSLDISQIKQAEKAMRESEKKFRDLTNFLPLIIFEIDLDGNVTFVNNYAYQTMGYTPEDFITGLNAMQMVIEQDRPRIQKNLQRILAGDRFPSEEFTLCRKDGSTYPAIITAATAKVDGMAVGFRGFIVDITERKAAEDALRKSEESYRGLFDSVNEAIYIQDELGNFLDVNEGAVRMYGHPREYFIGKTPELLSAPGRNNLMRVFKSVENAFAGKPQQFEFWGVRANGETFPNDVRLYPGTYFGQRVTIAMATDITERKKVEAALRESEARYRYYIDHVSDGVWCFQFEDAFDLSRPIEEKIASALDTVIVECNSAFATMMELSREQILGKRLSDLFPDTPETRAYIKHFFENGCRIDDMESQSTTADGTNRWVLISMFGEIVEGMLMNVWGRQTDITERKQVQSQVHRANLDLFSAYDATLEGWSHALEMRERETAGHSQRVAEMTMLLARALGITGEALIHVRRGALLHDIGKMGIPDSILLKPSPLSTDEWVVMRQHPTYAYQLLSSIPYLVPALDIPYNHHERWDGKGYPRGLQGEEIPLSARIFAVVDVWDALTSNRPYRPAWSPDPARHYLEEQAGTQFDPRIVEIFLHMV